MPESVVVAPPVREDATAEIARLLAQPGFDIDVGGPTTAAAFIRRGMVDEYRLFVHPVVWAPARWFFPSLDGPLGLELLETRTFGSGVVGLRFARARPPR